MSQHLEGMPEVRPPLNFSQTYTTHARHIYCSSPAMDTPSGKATGLILLFALHLLSLPQAAWEMLDNCVWLLTNVYICMCSSCYSRALRCRFRVSGQPLTRCGRASPLLLPLSKAGRCARHRPALSAAGALRAAPARRLRAAVLRQHPRQKARHHHTCARCAASGCAMGAGRPRRPRQARLVAAAAPTRYAHGRGICFRGASALSALAPARSHGSRGERAARCRGHAAHG